MSDRTKNFFLHISICLTIVVTLGFLFVLFDTSSFIASVKQTFDQTCETLLSLYQNENSETIKLTAEELKAAQNYISEAGEFFSVSANNSILSIIYAFVTTIMLSLGSFLLGKITLKSNKVQKKLNVLSKKIGIFSKEIDRLKKSNIKLLEFQNVTSYFLFSTILIFECEKNLENKTDNFKLLYDIANRLGMIPSSVRCMEMNYTSIDLNSDDAGVEESLFSNFEDFKKIYVGLIKHYIDYYKDSPNNTKYKNKAKDIESDFLTIDSIIDDIQRRLNSGFFDLKK